MALADQSFNVRHVHTNLGIFVHPHFFNMHESIDLSHTQKPVKSLTETAFLI